MPVVLIRVKPVLAQKFLCIRTNLEAQRGEGWGISVWWYLPISKFCTPYCVQSCPRAWFPVVTTREEREQNPPTAQLEILSLPAHRKNSSQECERATWFLCMSFPLSNSQGVVSSFPVCLSLVCGLTNPVCPGGVLWCTELGCVLCTQGSPQWAAEPAEHSLRHLAMEVRPFSWEYPQSSVSKRGKGKTEENGRVEGVMSQNSQCDTGAPSRCDLHQASLEASMSRAHGTDVHSTGSFVCWVFVGQPRNPDLAHSSPEVAAALPAVSHHARRAPSFPSLLSACQGSAVGVVRALQGCVSPRGFSPPLLREGPGSRAEHSVHDSLICVFASLPACSRARCFSLLE